MKVKYDPTVTAGNFIQILTMSAMVVVGYINLVAKVEIHSKEISTLTSAVSKVSEQQLKATKNLEVLTAIVHERTDNLNKFRP